MPSEVQEEGGAVSPKPSSPIIMKIKEMKSNRAFFILIFILILAAFVYFIGLPYYEYEILHKCKTPSDVVFSLDKPCPSEEPSDCASLVYAVHITTNDDGSLANFTCEFGPAYPLVNATITPILKDCTRENIELLNTALRGQSKEDVPYARLQFVVPSTFKNYTYIVLACQYMPSKNKYTLFTLANYSGMLYP